MIRPAKPGDLSRICALMAEVKGPHPLSIERKFKPLVWEMIRGGNTCVFVDDPITGFIMGSVEPLHQIYDVMFATNVFFHQGESGEGLATAFTEWAETRENVVQILVSVWGHEEAVAYTAAGLACSGKIYMKEVGDGLLQ